jgi:xanthine dehydrogenase accessory factor
MKNIYLQILEHENPGELLVLATVVRTHGSTPRKPGSSALFGKAGLLAGTIGGGVVEGRVQKYALEAGASKKSGLFRFDMANDISRKEEAICGGEISVLIDANLRNYSFVFDQLRSSLEHGIRGVLITMVTRYSEETVLINRYWMTMDSIPELPEEFAGRIKKEVSAILEQNHPDEYCELELSIPDEEPASLFFLEAVFPNEKLVIAGAGHIGRALAHIASLLDFQVTVIDDRAEYANIENIPDADHIIVDDIGKALAGLSKIRDTYVVIVTRGHKDDAEALKPCIGSDLAYIGMIGSRSKVASMKNSFIQNGWADAGQWEKIFAPVGVDIKSETVEEIAVSIAAQLVLVRSTNRKH